MYDKVKFYYIFTECLNYILEIYVSRIKGHKGKICSNLTQFYLHEIQLYLLFNISNHSKTTYSQIIHRTLSETRSQKLILRNT